VILIPTYITFVQNLGMEFIDPLLDKYVCEHTANESDLLKKINRETHLEVLQPRMLSGHFQGRVLSMFSKMIRPERILEIGTYTGYSAICLAEGLTPNGKLVTIDINEELASRVRGYFAESSYANQIDYLIGDAMELIPALNEKWDIVFIDADKHNYINYYHLVFPMVKVGGYIIADNVLWSGKVIDPSQHDKDTLLLREYNQLVHQDNRVEEVLFPIRDGLMIARKINE
jgi:predicted O-methyltransferase YrrM